MLLTLSHGASSTSLNCIGRPALLTILTTGKNLINLNNGVFLLEQIFSDMKYHIYNNKTCCKRNL